MPPSDFERVVGYDIRGGTILHRAACVGEIAEIENALQAGYDVNQISSEGQTPFALAAQFGRYEAVCLLLDAGANINDLHPEKGSSALFTAALHGHAKIVEALIKRHAKVECTYILEEYTITPLIAAVSVPTSEKASVVRLLLEARADTSAQRNDGCTALHVALATNLGDIVPMLLEGDQAAPTLRLTTHDGCTVLDYAVICGNLEWINILLGLGADPNAFNPMLEGVTSIRWAVQLRRLDIVKLLVERGARIDFIAITPQGAQSLLDVAETYGHTNVYIYLFGLTPGQV